MILHLNVGEEFHWEGKRLMCVKSQSGAKLFSFNYTYRGHERTAVANLRASMFPMYTAVDRAGLIFILAPKIECRFDTDETVLRKEFNRIMNARGTGRGYDEREQDGLNYLNDHMSITAHEYTIRLYSENGKKEYENGRFDPSLDLHDWFEK